VAPPTAPHKKEKAVSAKKKEPCAEPKKESEPVAMTEQKKNTESCADVAGREILSVIRGEMSVDEIAEALSASEGKNFEIGALLGMLTLLELDGFLCALPGGKYRLN
jgi:hypothetical protein